MSQMLNIHCMNETKIVSNFFKGKIKFYCYAHQFLHKDLLTINKSSVSFFTSQKNVKWLKIPTTETANYQNPRSVSTNFKMS